MTGAMRLEDVTFTYPGARRPAVDRATVAFEPGSVTALMGPSGSGKSTLLDLVAGLRSPVSGHVHCDDARLGAVFQDRDLWSHLRAWEHLAICMARGATRSARRRRALELLEQVGLRELAERRPHQLSGGEARRLSIARALSTDPAWLLLDEPFSQLDDPTRAHVRDLVRDVHRRSGVGIVIATHRAEDVLGFASAIAILHEGRIVQASTPETAYAEPVDLDAARLLGPAVLIDGTRAGRAVRTHRGVVAEGLEPGSIVRPEGVAFRASGEGACTLVGRLPTGAGVVDVPGEGAPAHLGGVDCDPSVPIGARGLLIPGGASPRV